MYAQRFQPSHASRPFSAGAALLINGAIFTALIFAVPTFVPKPRPTVMEPVNVPLQPDPPPVDPVHPKEKVKAETPIEKIFVPPTTNTTDTKLVIDSTDEPPVNPPGPVVGTGTEIAKPAEPPAPPPLIAPKLDSRYADALQPPYPAGELRVGKEGVAKVRVLVGTDGRVKDVQKISADSDAFFDATRRQALSKWRFKPATRGGTAEEAWYTATVRFTINNQ